MTKDAIIDIGLFWGFVLVFAAVAVLSREAGVSKIVVLVGYTACMLLASWFLMARRNRAATRDEEKEDACLLLEDLFQERRAILHSAEHSPAGTARADALADGSKQQDTGLFEGGTAHRAGRTNSFK